MATTPEASEEEDEPDELTTTAKASSEEAEETMRPSERLQHGKRQCVYETKELTTMTKSLAEEDRPEESATIADASAKDKELTTRPRDIRQQRRRRGINDGPKGSTPTTEALAKEDEHKDFNNNNGDIGRGYKRRPRDQRRRRGRQRLEDGPDGLETTTECQFSLLSRC